MAFPLGLRPQDRTMRPSDLRLVRTPKDQCYYFFLGSKRFELFLVAKRRWMRYHPAKRERENCGSRHSTVFGNEKRNLDGEIRNNNYLDPSVMANYMRD